jgi:3-methyl-2-oxobutanoate hydroxymethyltransferase
MEKKLTIPDLVKMKRNNEKITMLTAYDFPIAKFIEAVGIDIILVGDSLGMVTLGYSSTLPVTMDEMIHHSKAVQRGAPNTFLIGDMPFMSYQISSEEAIKNAARFLKEAGCDAIKLEGGREISSKAKAIIDAGIPVLGHLGLTPQSATKLGGFKVQGKNAKSARKIIEDSLLLEKIGCFALILECIPEEIAKEITESLNIPTIGIGAGAHCDGQVLVINDVLGLFEDFRPKFVKQYLQLANLIKDAIKNYKNEVKQGVFPQKEHCFHIKEEEFKKVKQI